MKANFNNSLNSRQLTGQKHCSSNQYEFDEHKNKDGHYTNNITRPAQAISFGGSAVSMATNFVENKTINKLIGFVGDNEAAYNAIYSLLIAGVLKPLLVLRTKGTDEKDNQIIATKNFLQAFIGSFLGCTVGGGLVKKANDITKNNFKLIKLDKQNGTLSILGENSDEALDLAESVLKKTHKIPFSDKLADAKAIFNSESGVKKLKSLGAFFKKENFEPTEDAIKSKAKELVETCNRHMPIFEKNPGYIKKIIEKIPHEKSSTTLYQAYESFWKNSTGWITAIMKAKISSWLLPGVMAFLFAKRNLEKQQQLEKELAAKNASPLLNSKSYKDEQENFSAFLNKKTKNNAPSFTGNLSEPLIDGLAMGIEKLSMTKPMEKCVNLLQKTKKPSARMADLESVLLTGYWVQNTTRSKKIDPDQKLGLNTQSVLVTIVSSASAFIIDNLLDGFISNGKKEYSNAVQKSIQNFVKESETKEIADLKTLEKAIGESCSKLLDAEEIAKAFVKPVKKDIGEGSVNKETIKAAIEAKLADKNTVVEIADKLAGSYKEKLSKFKSLTIFTLVVRFLVPVLMVKPAGKLKQKIKKMQQEKEAAKAKQTTAA